VQEVGENVQIQTLLTSSSGWRGRAQQIAALQLKVYFHVHLTSCLLLGLGFRGPIYKKKY